MAAKNNYGTLTIYNASEVADRLRRMLEGKLFTTVMVKEHSRFKPGVRLKQQLKDVNVRAIGGKDPVTVLNIEDQNYLLPIETSSTEYQGDNGVDPYFKFSSEYEGEQVTFSYRSCGSLYHYTIMVEGPIPADGPFTVGEVVNEFYKTRGFVAKITTGPRDIAFCYNFDDAEQIAGALNAK